MKNVLVIGGTSGYGKGIAEYLTGQGHNVISAGRTSLPSLDVTKDETVDLFFKGIKSLDVVVYSAGIAIGKDHVKDKPIADMRRVFEVNTIGLLNVLRKSYPFLLKTSGHFLHVGSIAYSLSYVGGADYCASKAASNSIMKTIRKEWLSTGIRTTSLEVGLGDTNFQSNRYNGDQEKSGKHTGTVRQIKPIDLGLIVSQIIELPDYLNMDEICLKPIDQASHGITIDNLNKIF